MKRFYNAFFHMTKCGKVREEVMLIRVATTVFVMIACLTAMGISAYAYFSCNITSGPNTIKGANFEASVSIQIADSTSEPVKITRAGAVQSATLYAGKTYSVRLEKAGTAKTGFCVMTATGCNMGKYHTQQLGKDIAIAEEKTVITFTLTVTDTTTVSFYSHWGTSTYYAEYVNTGENNTLYIVDNETVRLEIVAPKTEATE